MKGRKKGNKIPRKITRKITLTQKRKAELKRKYHGREAVGKAVLKYFLEEISAGDNPNYEFTLNGEELKFIENELGEYGTQRDLFVQYYMYTRIISMDSFLQTQAVSWFLQNSYGSKICKL